MRAPENRRADRGITRPGALDIASRLLDQLMRVHVEVAAKEAQRAREYRPEKPRDSVRRRSTGSIFPWSQYVYITRWQQDARVRNSDGPLPLDSACLWKSRANEWLHTSMRVSLRSGLRRGWCSPPATPSRCRCASSACSLQWTEARGIGRHARGALQCRIGWRAAAPAIARLTFTSRSYAPSSKRRCRTGASSIHTPGLAIASSPSFHEDVHIQAVRRRLRRVWAAYEPYAWRADLAATVIRPDRRGPLALHSVEISATPQARGRLGSDHQAQDSRDDPWRQLALTARPRRVRQQL